MIHFDEKIEFSNVANDVLTVGELLVDMISDGYDSEKESKDYHAFFGGSPANIAMNIKRLGAQSTIASAVGKDRFGNFLLNHLIEAGIGTHLIQQVEQSTSLVVVTKSTSTPIPIFYRGADYHLKYSDILEQKIIDSKIVHFSCWPASSMPVRTTLEQVIQTARQHNCLICFDPNYHPAIWQHNEDGISYVKHLISQSDIVKPSEDDANRLFGEASYEEQLENFLQLGAKLVVMTLGKDGAIVSNGVETIRFDTMATEVVDTTGAGDAFWSGFYTALVKGCTVKQGLKLGFAVSAYKLRYVGAVVDLPNLEVVQQMFEL
ncbi:carbohydrate kinase family protein [Paenibacillus phocaensis]|uniref:carbohydrate kinase family protein n=1 Tax=Paenibacillus phocaensis TaxID=1776378 RepID=UPI000839D103|nr:sugar kinase [Paenibacillus phocaensis]